MQAFKGVFWVGLESNPLQFIMKTTSRTPFLKQSFHNIKSRVKKHTQNKKTKLTPPIKTSNGPRWLMASLVRGLSLVIGRSKRTCGENVISQLSKMVHQKTLPVAPSSPPRCVRPPTSGLSITCVLCLYTCTPYTHIQHTWRLSNFSQK